MCLVHLCDYMQMCVDMLSTNRSIASHITVLVLQIDPLMERGALTHNMIQCRHTKYSVDLVPH